MSETSVGRDTKTELIQRIERVETKGLDILPIYYVYFENLSPDRVSLMYLQLTHIPRHDP